MAHRTSSPQSDAADTIRFVVVDDHPIVRQGFAELLPKIDPRLQFCGEADNVLTGMRVIETTRPDCALIDLSLRDGEHGFDLIRQVKDTHPDLVILVITEHDEAVYAERSLRVGAAGCVQKTESVETVVDAIRRVTQGKVYLSSGMQDRMLDRLARGARSQRGQRDLGVLSNRELHVFELLGRGLSVREIAERLNISVKTTQVHRHNIKTKLHFSTSRELDRFAAMWSMNQNAGADGEAAPDGVEAPAATPQQPGHMSPGTTPDTRRANR